MQFNYKNVLVIGTGKSVLGAVTLLNNIGCIPIILEQNREITEEQINVKLGELNSKVIIGALPEDLICSIDLVIISPGVPVDSELVLSFVERGVMVWGEVELAYFFTKGNIIAITGTNGKTTTTALVGQIMKDYFESVYVVGNIGNPYTDIALNTNENTTIVAEISSFQLETIHEFHPKVSAILNITPDHLNRHHTMENYIATKEKITLNQTVDEICVLNYEDEVLREFGKRMNAKPYFFSTGHQLEDGLFYQDGVIYLAEAKEVKALLNVNEMALLGVHNYENVMAAIAMSYQYGVPMENILSTVKSFQAVEHRIEFVATKAGVDYYNDSKATNPDAAIKGIQAMNKPTFLIGGGYDKDNEYDEWIVNFPHKVKKLILLGQTREKIAKCCEEHEFYNYIMVESLEEAIDYCKENSVPGEAVLLSPACASWGMFPNYEVRGQIFKELVHKILED